MEKRNAILPQVKARCEKSKIRWKLVDGIICRESAYDQWAVRYEKKVIDFQLPENFSKLNRTTIDSEVQLQKFSYGLGQILGTTARRLGFNGPLMQLCEIDLNIFWTCKLIERLMVTYRFEDDVIAAYNMGSAIRKKDGTDYVNQEYVDAVHAFMK
jgi:Transglycosylase SLT domain